MKTFNNFLERIEFQNSSGKTNYTYMIMEQRSFIDVKWDRAIAKLLMLCGILTNLILLLILSINHFESNHICTQISVVCAIAMICAMSTFGSILIRKEKYYSCSQVITLLIAYITYPVIIFCSREGIFLSCITLVGILYGLLCYKSFKVLIFSVPALLIYILGFHIKVRLGVNINTSYAIDNEFLIILTNVLNYTTSLALSAVATNRLSELYIKLKDQSVKDTLTGAYNRTYLRASNLENCGILMIDIDHFKKINDTYGHINGDDTLKFLVKTVQNFIRKQDLIIRYGGEEFVIVLKDVRELRILTNIAESLRLEILTQSRLCKDLKAPISVSIGAHIYSNSDSIEANIKTVDTYLYAAKHAGRNCTVSEEGTVNTINRPYICQ